MKGKIALEEHFAIRTRCRIRTASCRTSIWTELSARLLDIHGKRLQQMDEHGIEMMLLSLNAPAIQAIPDVKKANELAIKANDFLAEQVAKRPGPLPGACGPADAGSGHGHAANCSAA